VTRKPSTRKPPDGQKPSGLREATEAEANAETRAREEDAAREAAEQRAHEEAAARETAEAQVRQEAAARKEAEQRAQKEAAARETAEAQVRQEAAARKEAEQRAQKQAAKRKKAEAAMESLEESAKTLRAEDARASPRSALYDQWQSSGARAVAHADFWRFVSGGIVVTLLGAALLIATLIEQTRQTQALLIAGASVSCALFVVGVAVANVGYGRYSRRLAEYSEERELVAAKADTLKDTATDRDLEQLLRLNRTQMQAYQALSRGQQRSSFRSSLIALFAGLSVLIAGIVLVVEVGGDTSKIAAAAVAAIGSALSGYIAKTYLTLHKEAADQLRYFADQPIIASYIYEAERLAGLMKDDKDKEKVYESVVQEILAMTRQAQGEAIRKGSTRASGLVTRANSDDPVSSETE
jgi:hypothetical protein